MSNQFSSLFPKKTKLIFRENIIGARTISNYCWASLIFCGSFSFFIVGIFSFLNIEHFFFVNTENILFFPQGLVMCFYGSVGFFLSLYLWLVITWNVGSGFNEFNKETGKMRIVRNGFPGRNRFITFSCPIIDIEALRIEFQTGLTSRRALYIRTKEKQDIPLTQIGQPLTLEEVENKAVELAAFLQISIIR